ncbi:MAG: FtsX-like permease family protein [Candidatus Zixiibacteriota bacterium]|jgi:ABC-type lipoprotein release transport system permease subunit
MLILRLAIRNLIGAGLKVWLNGVVLSISFLAIITTQALLKGMYEQTADSMIAAQLGGGQYWQNSYDPYDPLTFQGAHAPVPDTLAELIHNNRAAAVLIIQGTIYPEGRIRPVVIRGIDPSQRVLDLPTHVLGQVSEPIPVLIGHRMSKATGLAPGDLFTLQWRDANGTFDARDAVVSLVMKTSVQSIDIGQIWVPLQRLQSLSEMHGEATMVVLHRDLTDGPQLDGWSFRSQAYLLRDVTEMVRSKSMGSLIIYALLLCLALLAIFDTQIFSIFRRKKEIGTLMALGLTRRRVIKLFTLEGAMQAGLGAFIGAAYGIPLLSLFAERGWTLLETTDSYGFALGEKLYPVFTLAIVLGTTVLVFIATTIVSYLPTRQIARLEPTEALRGRVL